jgi:hypothetical protein
MVLSTPPVLRGCGSRVAGGVYLATPLGPNGHPVECYILDPPRPVEAAVLGLSARGVQLFQDARGTTHVMDIIGSDAYPNVADFLEETRRFGLSRRIAKTADFAALGPGSRIFCVHARAYIENARELQDAILADRDLSTHVCPAFTAHEHCGRGTTDEHSPCAALWWHDVEGADPRDGLRTLGSTAYRALPISRPVALRYQLAIFAALPIHQLEVVQDREGGSHESALEKAEVSRLPVVLVDD